MVQRAKKRNQKHQRNRKGNREGEKRKVSNLHLSRNHSKQDVERDPARCSKQPPYRTATEVEICSERKEGRKKKADAREEGWKGRGGSELSLNESGEWISEWRGEETCEVHVDGGCLKGRRKAVAWTPWNG